MIGSIDCMHWQWKNCPTAWQGDYGNRKGQKSIILEAVAGFDTWVWHAFFGVAGSQNDLNVLGQSPVFNDVLRGEGPNITYEINNIIYQTGYYLADGIYPRWTTFVKTIPHPRSYKQKFFARYQEGYRKDVERCFGILQASYFVLDFGLDLGPFPPSGLPVLLAPTLARAGPVLLDSIFGPKPPPARVTQHCWSCSKGSSSARSKGRKKAIPGPKTPS
ncbi:hypothetical protein L3X38_008498 [Prunus dulcis]|uniref:Protein ALP1-like n=1 Tax=Prunus dulcis TaxID=3755 RepID=A0AAD4ZWW2_PRUDU|nr:hypothetical protein L3X38_008498 [Prunus dulcis]